MSWVANVRTMWMKRMLNLISLCCMINRHLFFVKVMSAITHVIKSYLRSADNDLKEQADTLNQHLDSVTSFIQSAISNDPSILHTAARDFSFRLSQIYIGNNFNYVHTYYFIYILFRVLIDQPCF